MSCEGCYGELKAQNAEREKIFQAAIREAKRSGNWYIVYQEPATNEWRYIVADAAPPGIPKPNFISPQLQDTYL